jgi:hypothetical protein
MAYTPTVPSASPETGPEYIYQELLRVAEALQLVEDGMAIQIRHVPPKKVREGMLAIADGTDWNPGAGKGLYEYRNGFWAKL